MPFRHEKARSRTDSPSFGTDHERVATRHSPGRPLKVIFALAICAWFLLVGCVASYGKDPEAKSKKVAPAIAALVQSVDKVEQQEHDWGWLRWMMNSKLDPKAEMTFGLVQINPGHRNPMHTHPNCEEQLYMLSGSCEQWIGKEMVVLKAGDVVRIPRGAPHYAKPIGAEPMKAVIVYSSSDRQFVVVDENSN